jgi:2,5-diamino-6-(ribosylamino)-4(3H)-pyrimidinone 5'-phosphate reductase
VAIEKLLDHTGSQTLPEDLYTDLQFPEPPQDRPYIYNNMVSTVDGKILIAPPGSTAKGVGGPTDQLLMRRLQAGADATIIGAGTLRPGNVIYDPRLWRAVITRSGELPLNNRFFTDAPEKAIVFAPRSLSDAARERLGNEVNLRLVGEDAVDVVAAVRNLASSASCWKAEPRSILISLKLDWWTSCS